MSSSGVLIIGLGNPLRGDDGVGAVVAADIRARNIAGVDAVAFDGDISSLLDRWQDAQTVIVVDASRSAGPPGSIVRLEESAGALPAGPSAASTHGFGLGEALALARALDQLPPRLVVYAISGQSFEIGAVLSPAVAAAVPSVVNRVLEDLAGSAA